MIAKCHIRIVYRDTQILYAISFGSRKQCTYYTTSRKATRATFDNQRLLGQNRTLHNTRHDNCIAILLTVLHFCFSLFSVLHKSEICFVAAVHTLYSTHCKDSRPSGTTFNNQPLNGIRRCDRIPILSINLPYTLWHCISHRRH